MSLEVGLISSPISGIISRKVSHAAELTSVARFNKTGEVGITTVDSTGTYTGFVVSWLLLGTLISSSNSIFWLVFSVRLVISLLFDVAFDVEGNIPSVVGIVWIWCVL